MSDRQDVDWRKLPRKDDEPRSERLSIRVTASEKRGIEALAERRGQTISNFIVSKVLRKANRK